jgi:hypothetical protein
MLAEHEVTRMMSLLGPIAERLGVEPAPEDVEVETDVALEAVD